jgi:hypothetical protein
MRECHMKLKYSAGAIAEVQGVSHEGSLSVKHNTKNIKTFAIAF